MTGEKRIHNFRTLAQFAVAVTLFAASSLLWVLCREGDWADPGKPMFEPGTFWALVFAVSPLAALASSLWILVIVFTSFWPFKGRS